MKAKKKQKKKKYSSQNWFWVDPIIRERRELERRKPKECQDWTKV